MGAGFTGRLKYLCMCRGTSTAASREFVEDAGAIVAAAPTGSSRECACATEEEDVAAPKRAVEAAEVSAAAGSPPA